MDDTSEKTYLAVTKEGFTRAPANKLVQMERTGQLKVVRGIRNPDVLKRLLVETLADPRRRFNPNRFARIYGVEKKTLQKWLRQKELNALVKERIKEVIGGGVFLSKLYKKITRQAIAGSFKHQRLLFEIVGEYKPGLDLKHDVHSPERRFRELEQQRRDKQLAGATGIEG